MCEGFEIESECGQSRIREACIYGNIGPMHEVIEVPDGGGELT